MPKITVWLTSYNHEKFISKTIDSILNQTFQDFELIIIDDCSTDHSWEIIKKYANQDKRIRPIRHETNMGGSQLDDSLDLINGEYVAIAHSDDVWDLTKLEKQFNFLDNNKNYIACFTLVNLIDENDNIFKDTKHHYYNVFNQPNRNRYEWLRYFYDNGNCLCHPSVLIRKKIYYNQEIKPIGYHSFPDFYRWIKICSKYEIYVLQEKLTYFRIMKNGEIQDSGESDTKYKQIYTEEFLLVKEYFNLKEKDTIVNIFPESEKYFLQDDYVPEFIISKMFLLSQKKTYQLAAMEKLFELLNNKEESKKIYELYNYDNKQFSIDKKTNDIFRYINSDRYITASLYFDYGNGFSQEDSITKKVFINNSGIVDIIYEIEEYQRQKEIKQMRFDPDEHNFRKIKMLQVLDDNDNSLEINSVNSFKDNGMDVFFTLDPQYLIKGKARTLKFKFYIKTLDIEEIDDYKNIIISKNIKKQKQTIFMRIKNKLFK